MSRVRHVQRRGEGAAVDAAEGLADFGQTVELWWRKRRLVCGEVLCPRKTFTQVSIAVRPRARVTERLRQRVAHAIASSNRAVSDVACVFGVCPPCSPLPGRPYGPVTDATAQAKSRSHECSLEAASGLCYMEPVLPLAPPVVSP